MTQDKRMPKSCIEKKFT